MVGYTHREVVYEAGVETQHFGSVVERLVGSFVHRFRSTTPNRVSLPASPDFYKAFCDEYNSPLLTLSFAQQHQLQIQAHQVAHAAAAVKLAGVVKVVQLLRELPGFFARR